MLSLIHILAVDGFFVLSGFLAVRSAGGFTQGSIGEYCRKKAITTKTTMKELRENPSIKGSGYYTYCNEWIEGSTQYDDTPIRCV